MKFVFVLKKMTVRLGQPVEYFFEYDNNKLSVNDFLGKNLSINFINEIYCRKCGVEIKNTYGEGFCYKCFVSAPEADACIVRPELCKAHLGISRDIEWSEKNCLTEHFVYLAITDKIKVGVTRKSQVPVRWIDQGAIAVIKFAKTPYRQLAGLIEIDLKRFYSDKTNWRDMLTCNFEKRNLLEEKRKAAGILSPEYLQYLCTDNDITEITYPMLEIPNKVKSVNLTKTPQISGILTGIKGQYLIFDNEKVLNIRKFTGYKIEISIN